MKKLIPRNKLYFSFAVFISIVLVLTLIGYYVQPNLRLYALGHDKRKIDIESQGASNASPAATGCLESCRKLAECNLLEPNEECLMVCSLFWPEFWRECISVTDCRKIEPLCFDQPVESDCRDVCNRIMDCAIPYEWNKCVQDCDRAFTPEIRDCVLRSDCPAMEERCLTQVHEPTCDQFCDQLLKCGLWKPEDRSTCLDLCRQDNYPQRRKCVVDLPCDMIDPMCFNSNFEPGCAVACHKLSDCGLIDSLTFPTCLNTCQTQWMPSELDCVLSAACEDVEGTCFGPTNTDCQAACRRIVECGLEEDTSFCYQSCKEFFTPEECDCTLYTPCSQIALACFNLPGNDCPTACARLVNCDLIDDLDDCLETCPQLLNEDEVKCVIDTACNEIQVFCLMQPPESPPEKEENETGTAPENSEQTPPESGGQILISP